MLTIILKFDNGQRNQYYNAFSYMKKKNIPGVIYLIGQTIEKGWGITFDNALELQNNGWEIGYKSYSAQHQTIYNPALYDQETNSSKLTSAGLDINSFCIPGLRSGTLIHDVDAQELLGKLSQSYKTLVGVPNQTAFNSPANKPAFNLYNTYVVSYNTKADELKKLITTNVKSNQVIILSFQNIIDKSNADDLALFNKNGGTKNDSIFYDFQEFKKLIDYLAIYQGYGVLKVSTPYKAL
jgi:hypothetical protein